MATKQQLIRLADKFNAEVEVSRGRFNTQVSVFASECNEWCENGSSVLSDSAESGFSIKEVYDNLIEMMESGYA